MKERPILFSPPMVRAILENRKTQTRRIAKIERIDDHPEMIGNDQFKIVTMKNGNQYWMNESHDHPHSILNACPHGRIGDVLWVRETYLECSIGAVYRADNILEIDAKFLGGWKQSIFMPRELSRITLEITNIRVERLQEISEEDAIAEGAEPFGVGSSLEHMSYRAGYQYLWEQINGKRSWDLNPFVWVIQFRRV